MFRVLKAGYHKGEQGTGRSDRENTAGSEMGVGRSEMSGRPELLGFLKQKDG